MRVPAGMGCEVVIATVNTFPDRCCDNSCRRTILGTVSVVVGARIGIVSVVMGVVRFFLNLMSVGAFLCSGSSVQNCAGE